MATKLTAEDLLKRARVNLDRGDYDAAISDYTEAIRLRPNLSQAYQNRGLVYSRKKEHEQAIADYTKAILIDPKYAKAYFNRGLAFSW